MVFGKLKRAESEIARLDSYVNEQVSRNENRATLRVRRNKDSKGYEIYISEIPDLEDFKLNVSITVGVVVHLLRSTLDNLVFNLAYRNTGGSISKPKSIQFPISEDEKSWRRGYVRCLKEIYDNDINIIYSNQPLHGIAGRPDVYSGPYIHQLSLLRDISNADKHQQVVGISVDPNHFEFVRDAVPLLNAWREWIRDNHLE